MNPLSASWRAAALCLLVGVTLALPKWLDARDDAVLLAYPRPPVPDHGRMTTISHDDATMAKIAAAAAADAPDASAFARSFDMYYEAQLDGCDPTKNAVIIGGTNGASWLTHPLVEALRERGYCTLNFDHRVHGRSASPPGELSAELLGEDAAQIIDKVFGGKPVHVYGWSLGGNVGYYLALEHPELVKSVTLQGVTSCMGFAKEDGGCDTSFNFFKWFFSRDLPLRLMGTELLGKAGVAAGGMHDTDETMYFYRTMSPATMTRTPQTWYRWRQEEYHEKLRNVKVPVLLLAGEHDALMTCDEVTMKADVQQLGGPAEYKIFPGFSHFMKLEQHNGERGVDLIADAFATFHGKHFGGV